MPKYWFCLLLTVNSYYCFSQHEVHVLIKYLPAHTYTLNSDQITNINFDFTGNWDSLTSPPGTGKPIRKTVVSQTEAITNTGAFYNDSLFPVRTEITKKLL